LIEETRREGIIAQGFISPDIVFYSAAVKQELDIVVVMYYGQCHIPLKLQGVESGVIVTVGLPLIRTATDRDTALNIAWRSTADTHHTMKTIRNGGKDSKRNIAER
jgi:4-phospho-D-threonate 3-dehydrogenase / 4-phospho-D-erythronate 3-dehydrogenase